MWDIKDNYLNVGRFWGAFHLNHVGYKVVEAMLQSPCHIIFHLNHVGYKVVLRKKFLLIDTFFHLNHVGYKGRICKRWTLLGCSFI